MQQTIEQAVEAHRAGNLHEAEALYRAILKDQPQHPDANHNLGIIAVFQNHSKTALPFLKTALEANSSQRQYWLSYIDALIKDDQFETARLVLEQGKKVGLAGEKVVALEDRVRSILGNLESKGSEPNQLTTPIQLREAGKYKEAQAWLNSFLESNPNSAEAWSLLSQVLMLDKQEIASEKALETAALFNRELPSIYRNQARLLLKQVKPIEALQKASFAYDRSLKDPESLLVLAACLAANNRDKEALPLIEKCIQARPSYAEAFVSRALLRLKRKDLMSAMEDLEVALSFKPHLGQIWGLLGSVRYQNNDLSGAIRALQKVHELEPANASNMVLLGEFFRLASETKEAITILERASELEPENANAWTNLGVTWQQLGSPEKAKYAFEKSLSINPKSAEVSNSLGIIEKDAGKWESARTCFEQATKIKPGLAQAHSNLGVTLQELGRLEEAEASYRQAIALKPDFAQAHYNLGKVLMDLGRLEDSQASYRQVIALKPDFVEAYCNLGNTLEDLGRLEDALASYRQAIALKPDFAQAHYNLGKVLTDLGRLEDSQVSYRQAIALKPDFVEAYCNLGNTLEDLGRLEDAQASYRQAIALKPNYAQAHGNLGVTLQQLGRLEEAEASYRHAIALKPDFAQAHSNLGKTLQQLGLLQDAQASYKQAIALKPDFAQAINNLGNAQKELGQLEDAEASYRHAIAIKPDFAQAHSNLGATLIDLGRLVEALNSVVASLRIKPTAVAKINFVNIVKYIAPKYWDTAVAEMVTSALVEPWARPSSVMGVACRLLKLDAGLRSVLSQTNAYATQSADASFLDSFVANPLESSALLHAVMSSSYIADHELEQLFTKLRQHFLMQVTPNMSDELQGNDVPALYCYLAQQCFINEYVFFETVEEIEHLQLVLGRLKTAIGREEKISATLVIAVACYVPLHSVLGAQSLLQRYWPADVASVLKQQIQEPLDELALRASIPSLTNTENTVSLEVQRMYEENPYPRWVKLPKENSARTLNASIKKLFPFGAFRELVDDRSPEILVAGCGTGQHPIGTALGMKGARVLAIDLSMASLSYAKRKTTELGVDSLEYAQADLLKLGSLGQTFDVIESSGVLHHLENPFEGWEVLLSLLKPHGLMKLGLYSEIARRGIVKVRGMIAKDGVGSSAQEIRAYRKLLLELKDSDGFGKATTIGDFFSTSACRDLLFHVQEHRMTLPVLSNFFKKNNLNFLGFEIDSSVTRSYKSRFPNDSSATDLKNWHIYEEENPDTFISMYQFWIQKSSTLAS